jgi:4-hydroxy-3-methylbut-2-enyl diphosphate reductase
LIFGDKNHPEVKGVKSYAGNDAIVIIDENELNDIVLPSKIAVVSQTTRRVDEFKKIISHLVEQCKEVRVFNTICNATFENQDATKKLAKEADVMIIIGGKNSSNTKQLFTIAKKECKESYLIEDETELKNEWFRQKKLCGITAGASTPDWVILNVKKEIAKLEND